MTVMMVDKRRPRERILSVELCNATWFGVLNIQGMDRFVNTANFNDPLDVTPAKAKKMAALLDSWTPPDSHEWQSDYVDLKEMISSFLKNCNGFRTH